MFYKPDGSWDREAYNKYRLEEEYQIGYGSGEEAGEKRGIAIGEKRGHKLGLKQAVKSLSKKGLSVNEIASWLNLKLDEVNELLNLTDN